MTSGSSTVWQFDDAEKIHKYKYVIVYFPHVTFDFYLFTYYWQKTQIKIKRSICGAVPLVMENSWTVDHSNIQNFLIYGTLYNIGGN